MTLRPSLNSRPWDARLTASGSAGASLRLPEPSRTPGNPDRLPSFPGFGKNPQAAGGPGKATTMADLQQQLDSCLGDLDSLESQYAQLMAEVESGRLASQDPQLLALDATLTGVGKTLTSLDDQLAQAGTGGGGGGPRPARAVQRASGPAQGGAIPPSVANASPGGARTPPGIGESSPMASHSPARPQVGVPSFSDVGASRDKAPRFTPNTLSPVSAPTRLMAGHAKPFPASGAADVAGHSAIETGPSTGPRDLAHPTTARTTRAADPMPLRAKANPTAPASPPAHTRQPAEAADDTEKTPASASPPAHTVSSARVKPSTHTQKPAEAADDTEKTPASALAPAHTVSSTQTPPSIRTRQPGETASNSAKNAHKNTGNEVSTDTEQLREALDSAQTRLEPLEEQQKVLESSAQPDFGTIALGSIPKRSA